MTVDARTLLRLGGPTAVVIAIWAVVGWRMPNGDAAAAEARIASAQAAIAAAQFGDDDRGDEADTLNARLELYQLAVPVDADQAGLFRRFDALGDEFGVELGSVQITEDESGTGDAAAMAFTDPTTGDGTAGDGTTEDPTTATMPPMPGTSDPAAGAPLTLRVLRISTDVAGPYGQVLDFVDALRASPRLLVIDQMSIVPDSEDPSIVSVNLDLRVFAQPTSATAPSTTPTAGDPTAGDPMAGTAPVAGSAG